ncbi:MAG: hypothetical protein GY930_02670 [bacterium]|nr:hypothetical protein [bacterium]
MLQSEIQFNPVEFSSSSGAFGGLVMIPLLMMVLHGIIAVACGIGIWEACDRVKARGDKVQMLAPVMWLLAGLLGSLVSVAIFWAMHESTLVRRKD